MDRYKFKSATVVLIWLILGTHVNSQSGLDLSAYGVWNRGNLEFDPAEPEYDYLIGFSAEVSTWRDIQPDDSTSFNWSSIRKSMDLAIDRDQYIYLGINFGPDAPEWIYENGVPRVFTTESGDKKHKKWSYYPFYTDQDYMRFYENFLIELGEFLKTQPAGKRERILFIQVKTGCTGDEAAYKGTVKDLQYDLPKNGKAWSDFRLFAFNVYNNVFNTEELYIPMLFNSVEPESFKAEWDWILSELGTGFGIKQGALVRGHHLTGEQTVVIEWKHHLVDPEELALFSRSEMDQTWTRPLYQINPELGFYWGALNGLNRGLSVWDISTSALEMAGSNSSVQNTFRFFNKYASQIYPASSDFAFIAFHEGLNASDTLKYPEGKYGEASRNNLRRYEAICADTIYASRGARMDDLSSAAKGQVYQRRAQKGYNDAGWDIWPGNYSRFINQIEPENTSIGLFRIGGRIDSNSPVYSRFARSFESSTGKNAMYFHLDENFIQSRPREITFKITYYDKEKGSKWELKYDAGEGNFKTAKTIKCKGDKKWKTISITVDDAVLDHNGTMECDFALINKDKQDDIFHMIEVEKQPGHFVSRNE